MHFKKLTHLYIFHQLTNYLFTYGQSWFVVSLLWYMHTYYGSIPLTLVLIGRDVDLSTLCHSCGLTFACVSIYIYILYIYIYILYIYVYIHIYIYNLLFCYLAGLPTANIGPLLWGQPHSPNAPNVNHCVLCLCLSQRVTGSLLMRLGL